MSFDVCQTNNTEPTVPQSLQELIDFVNLIKQKPERMYVQISGYGVEIVEALAKHYETRFFEWEQCKNVDMNPFTILYIDQESEVKRHGINEKSKIIVYARRPVYNPDK